MGSLACLPGFEDSPLDQPMYSHSARTKHLRSLQILCSGATGGIALLSRLAKPNGIGDTDGCPDSEQHAARRNP
jgi:hypothetical protein